MKERFTKYIRLEWGQKEWQYVPLPFRLGPVAVAWRRVGWSSVVRFELEGLVTSVVALLPGQDTDDDAMGYMLLRGWIERVLEGAGRKPPFEISTVEERPVALRVAWKNDQMTPVRRKNLRKLERAMSAAFFREVIRKSSY